MSNKFLWLGCLLCMAMPAHATDSGKPLVIAQASQTDYRVGVLEEQVRALNGRIEELNFQILEMQELIRRMQEDNDYRLREIEDKLGSVSPGGGSNLAQQQEDSTSLGKDEPSALTPEVSETGGQDTVDQATNPAPTIDGVEIYQGESGIDQNRPNTLGSIQFDENGNIVGTELGKPLDLTSRPSDQALESSLNTDASNPDILFSTGYDLVQTGRYEDAERSLMAFANNFPEHPKMPEARFWLGESYLGMGRYEDAARVYLDTHKRWPNGKFGPQSLLKLGVAMAGLNQRELACATFAEVMQKYPNASRVVQRNVAYEQRAARCVMN